MGQQGWKKQDKNSSQKDSFFCEKIFQLYTGPERTILLAKVSTLVGQSDSEQMKEFLKANYTKLRENVRIGLEWLDAKTAPVLDPVRERTYRFLRPAIIRYKWYRRSHPIKARVFLYGGSLAFFGTFFLLSFIGLVYFGAFGKLPTTDDLQNIDQNVASEVYSADSVLLGKYFVENRLPSEIEEISPFIIDGLVATEDARFFEHGGIDMRAWVRVLFRTIIMQDESGGGGSTLSQQLAKNLFPRKNHGFLTVPIVKTKEIFIARRLEEVYTKEQLLALYLNKVPFGEGAFGIQVAAKRFFDTNPKDIKLEEAAVLVGMLKGPSRYNPRNHPERSLTRRNVVLSQMVRYGKLDTLAYDSVSQLPLDLKFQTERHDEGLATYFRAELREELEKLLEELESPEGETYNLYTDGLRIFTTIDSRMQAYAEEAVREHMAGLQKKFKRHFRGYPNAIPWGKKDLLTQMKKGSNRYKTYAKQDLDETVIDSLFDNPVRMRVFTYEVPEMEKDTLMTPLDSIKHYLLLLHTGFIAAVPQTGEVKAWVGGVDFKHFKYDHIRSRRQVGSTFKPIVYSEALRQEYEPCERFDNELVKYANDYEPRNSDGQYGGNYSMAGALAKSVNVVAVALLKELGINNVRNLAKEMGISSKIPPELGIALGSADISLFEMVQAFGTFPNRGKVPTLYYLDYIENAVGDTIYVAPKPKKEDFKEILTEEHTDIMNHLLQMVVDSGTGRRIRTQCNFPYPVAGKTGTTNGNTDGWFIGYTPTLVTGAWVGAEQPAVRWRSTAQGQGGVSALPICGYFLRKVYKDKEFKSLRRKVFAPLDTAAISLLDCPDFIHPDSLIADSIRQAQAMQMDDTDRLIQAIRDAFKKPGENERDRPPRKPSEQSERIRKKNEKVDKKRKRQEKRRKILEKLKGGGG